MSPRTAVRPARQRAVVVGAGRAGVAAAEELRVAGFTGEVVVLHDEPTPPYDRPACAKGILGGRQRPADVSLPIAPGVDVDWRLGRRAAYLDPTAKVVTADTGEEIEYDGLVLATGARPVVPAGWPVGQPGFHVLYTVADAWRLRAELRSASVVAVVGAGLTGCEVASVVRSEGRSCVVVDPSDRVMGRQLGSMTAAHVTDELWRQGVDLRLGRRVTAVEPLRRGWLLSLDDGAQVRADVVVATVGERPDTTWLRGVPGLDASDGVLCDERLRVVGAPDVVAAGTVARWPNLQYSAEPVRVGQWITAWEHGRAAARSLLEGDSGTRCVSHVPRFWSAQFGLQIQVCGVVPDDSEVRVTYLRPGRRDVARSGLLVGHYGRTGLEGIVAVNATRAFTSMARGLLATAGPSVPAAQSGHRALRKLAVAG
ncbi:MAG: NAD(P)/FAD-dependent oxidoreductase [Kineosporiaceae bacterium]